MTDRRDDAKKKIQSRKETRKGRTEYGKQKRKANGNNAAITLRNAPKGTVLKTWKKATRVRNGGGVALYFIFFTSYL